MDTRHKVSIDECVSYLYGEQMYCNDVMAREDDGRPEYDVLLDHYKYTMEYLSSALRDIKSDIDRQNKTTIVVESRLDIYKQLFDKVGLTLNLNIKED